ncbi:hypothetical protein BH10PSE2_BH10PSE2_20940 [soil metagenome]
MTPTALSKRSPLMRLAAIVAPAVAGALLLGLPTRHLQAQTSTPPVLPGYWEYTTSAVGDRNTETKCVRPADINRFFGGISTRHYSCIYPTSVVGGGNARFEGSCQDKKGRRFNVRLHGTYRPESFRFDGGAQLLRGTPYIPASITARRLAATCPANAEYF